MKSNNFLTVSFAVKILPYRRQDLCKKHRLFECPVLDSLDSLDSLLLVENITYTEKFYGKHYYFR